MSITQPTFEDEPKNPFGEPTDTDFLDKMESIVLGTGQTFWNASPQLQLIAYRAYEKKASAWGQLAALLVHRLAKIPATVVLVEKDGTKGKYLTDGTSLNLFASLVSPTGGNKSTLFRGANNLIPLTEAPVSDGTGQGLVKCFAETDKITRDEDNKLLDEPRRVTRYYTHSIVVHAPEIGTLNAEFIREGSKTAAMLRSLWVGEIVGSTTGDQARRVTLVPNTYRLGGIWGVQPVNAYALLDESQIKDGTPQRWVWAPTEEYRDYLTRTAPPAGTDFPAPAFNVGQNLYGVSGGELPNIIELNDNVPLNQQLPAPIWVEWSPQMQIDVPILQAKLKPVGRQPYAKITPEDAEENDARLMESHFVLSRIKIAAAIGFLHGRCNPTDLDWELSGIFMEISRHELAGVWQRVQESLAVRTAKKGKQRGAEAHAMFTERDRLAEADDYSAAEALYQRMLAGPNNTTGLYGMLSNTKRKKLRTYLDILESQGRYSQSENGLHWAVRNGAPMPPEAAHQYR